MERTWEYAPTSDHIVQDIDRVFDSIDTVVVKAKGTAVDFKGLRHGRRDRDHRDCRGFPSVVPVSLSVCLLPIVSCTLASMWASPP